ncbi:MAG: flagellar hook protein FlgE [Pseudomonadota bacterium]
MPFNIGISGLNAANADLKTTGNNIANAGTIGFKSSRAEFSNIYSLTKAGAASTAIGSGVRVSSIAQQFTQGNVSFTQNTMDVAINGDGFYTLKDASGSSLYTRNGQFKVDKNGFVVTNDGYNLQGFQVDKATDTINTGQVGSLQLTTAQIPPRSTSTSELLANLDAASTTMPAPSVVNGGTAVDIDPADPSTYHHTTSYTTYDSLGNAMLTSLYFQKTEVAPAGANGGSEWIIGVRTVDGSGAPIPADNAVAPIQETTDFVAEFETSGTLSFIDGVAVTATTSSLTLDYLAAGTGNPTGAADQTFTIDIAGLTQYGANFGVNDLKQNGYTTGNLAGIEIDQSGIMLARFTNGESQKLGQIILAGFTNPQGLGQAGNNNWTQTFSSGEPVANVPGDGGLGLVTSGALEESNTDLTEDLINLIIAQRNFQANAKTITTADTITQTIINM